MTPTLCTICGTAPVTVPDVRVDAGYEDCCEGCAYAMGARQLVVVTATPEEE